MIYHIYMPKFINNIRQSNTRWEKNIYVNSTKKCQGSLFINIIPEDESLRENNVVIKSINKKIQCYYQQNSILLIIHDED